MCLYLERTSVTFATQYNYLVVLRATLRSKKTSHLKKFRRITNYENDFIALHIEVLVENRTTVYLVL